MVQFTRFTLENGLTVLIHEDNATPMAVTRLVYNVGSRDETSDKTGFAHLFEHLMFGGSIHIANIDEHIHQAGGNCNASTSDDHTQYDISVPAENIETALWLESDRMLSLAFNETTLEAERKIVVEEYKQLYENPYGDAFFKLRALAYMEHPYRWMTIGDIEHIKAATLEDVKAFFYKFYRPCNAALIVAGNVKSEEMFQLVSKWFSDIPTGEKYHRNLPVEPPQLEARKMEVFADVPADALFKCYPMGAAGTKEFYVLTLISYILGQGQSSRFYETLVKTKRLFSQITCSPSGSFEPGLFVIHGKLMEGVSMNEADGAVEEVLLALGVSGVSDFELNKAKNKIELNYTSALTNLENKASSLAYYEFLGNAEWINTDPENYYSTTKDDIQVTSKVIFSENKSNTLYYHRKK